jgi:hypothetical protein
LRFGSDSGSFVAFLLCLLMTFIAAFDANLPVVLSLGLVFGASFGPLLTGGFKSFSNGSYFSLLDRLYIHRAIDGALLFSLLPLNLVLLASFGGGLLSLFYADLPCGLIYGSFLNCLSSSLGASCLVDLLSLLSPGASFGGALLTGLLMSLSCGFIS